MSQEAKGMYGAVVLDVEQQVATKRSLDTADTQPFIRELFSLCALKQIHQVISLRDFNYTDRTLVLGLGQKTLAKLIDQRLSAHEDWGYSTEAVHLMWQLVLGMKHINETGVWHRDIKPDNILIDADSALKVIDFGLARVGAFVTTDTTSHVYTTWWRAPELLVANVLDIPNYRYNGRAAEIYAIGSTLLCVLLGNIHGILQGRCELAQLLETVNLAGGCALYNPSTFDEHDPNWRGVLAGKLINHKKRRRSTKVYSLAQLLQHRLPGVPETVLHLLTGMLHCDWESRFSYETILQHQFFDSVRVPYDQSLPRSWPSGILEVKCAITYKRLLVDLAFRVRVMNMSHEASLHMLALVDLVVTKSNDSPDQLKARAYSCLIVADALYAQNPMEVESLARDCGIPVQTLEDGVQLVLRLLQDCLPTTCLPPSIMTAWADHPLRSQLLQCYFTLVVSGARLSKTAAEIESLCEDMCTGLSFSGMRVLSNFCLSASKMAN